MSYDSSVKIGFSGVVPFTSILESYLRCGWSLDSSGEGYAVFTPLGAKEPADLAVLPASARADVFGVLDAKERAGERIEIYLAWPNPFTKCHFFVSKNAAHIFLGKGTERRQMAGFDRFTDYNWYMPKLISPLTALGLRISTILWNEVT